MKSVKVKSPATVANLVCGFDILGLCLDTPYDEFILSIIEIRSLNQFIQLQHLFSLQKISNIIYSDIAYFILIY
jgi:homoserine kinase